jgi:transcriptional regulator with XRE-family HTH domain
MKKMNALLGKIITKHRIEKELSQEKLADLAKIHRTYASQIERGLKSPTINVLASIAKALEIKLSDIISELEDQLK